MIPELHAVVYEDVHVVFIFPKDSNYIIAFSNYEDITTQYIDDVEGIQPYYKIDLCINGLWATHLTAHHVEHRNIQL